jgi:sugar phosphate isomerase/epimerase
VNSPVHSFSRRQFLSHSALIAAGTAAWVNGVLSARGQDKISPPIVVFTKVYQLLSLNFEDAAAITAEAQLNGVDIPVRPKGEVEPERVGEDLPRYAEALKKRNLSMPLLTTAITGVSSPQAETILRTAKKCGANYYRVGFLDRESDVAKQIREVKANLKDLAALNKEVGMTALLQNHSPAGHTYLGGDLAELRELVAGFEPAQIGVAFDIGHALIVHKEHWREHFERIKPHLKIAYIKDASMNGRWTRFGQGDVGKSGYFKLLRELHYQAPLSLHLEYDWHQNGKAKDRAALLQALKESSSVLKGWLATA